MSEKEKPYRLCGCIYCDTEAEAVAIRDLLLKGLDARGFTAEHYEENEDGSTTTRKIP